MSPLPIVCILSLALPQDPEAVRPDARELDREVVRLEAHLDSHPGDAQAWRELARTLELLVGDGGVSWMVLDDAGEAWDRALEREPLDVPTLYRAADLRLRTGEYERACALAMRAVGACRLGGEPPPEGLSTLAARARIGAWQGAEHADLEAWRTDLADAWAVAVNAGEQEANGEARVVQAGFAEVLGHPYVAAEVLLNALAVSPEDDALHRALIDMHVRAGTEGRLSETYALMTTGTASAAAAWYRGWVERLVGDRGLRERDFELTHHAYAQCSEWMRVAAALEDTFSGTARTVDVQARVGTAWSYLDAGDLEAAHERVLALLREEPDLVTLPDGLGRSALNAASALGERWVERSHFERASGVTRAVLTVFPEDSRWWNNLGFLLREYGTQMELGAFPEVADSASRAKEIFRESWRAYLRAVELVPGDARVVNDAALIQVYHVQEELERAEELLWRAIRMGEAQLEELGPVPDETERFPLAQAVGDAYENLGYLHYHVLDEPEESRPYWLASIATDSGDRSHFQEYLDAIDGVGDPVPLRDQSGFVQGPVDDPPARLALPWEASFEEGRAIAEAEGRALVIYNRGAALGLVVPFLDAFAASERFGAATEGAVLVVADGLRHTFVDRRADGRRLLCPMWPTITCAEHVRAAEEFASWYRVANGTEPGESEEGVWMQAPGEDGPTMLAALSLFEEGLPAAAEASAATIDLDAIALRLEGPEAAGAARRLVAIRRRAARDRIEEVLFGSAASAAARDALAAALAEDDLPAYRELLAAMAVQPDDPDLSRLALRHWPEDADTWPVEHAHRWSSSSAVREAARAILAGRKPQELERNELARRVIAGD